MGIGLNFKHHGAEDISASDSCRVRVQVQGAVLAQLLAYRSKDVGALLLYAARITDRTRDTSRDDQRGHGDSDDKQANGKAHQQLYQRCPTLSGRIF